MKAVGKWNDVRGVGPESEKTASFARGTGRDAGRLEYSDGVKGWVE